jgi:ABC-type glycerol-3-phosphate transport system substrate-binding protein
MKTTLKLSVLVLYLAIAVACASPPPAPTPVAQALTAKPTHTPSATAAPPSPTPRPSASPTPTPRRLRLWVGEADAALDAMRAIAANYEASSGVRIELIAKAPDTLRLSVAGVDLTGDPPPDMIWADQEALAGLLADGQLQPVKATGDPLPGLLADATTDGKLWGVPLTARGGLLLLYNRTLAAAPPATSDELSARSRVGGAGLVMAWDEPRWLLPWLYGFGGAPTGGPAGAPTLDTPEMRSALGLLRELAVASPQEVKTYRGGQRWFGAGEVAFAVDGDWALPEYRTLTETLDLGIAPLPVIPATGRRALPVLGGSFLMFQRDLAGADRARAEAFAAFLASPATQARLAHDLGRLPASQKALGGQAALGDPALAVAATLAANAPGLPPTKAARCALFGIDVWLPSLLKGTLDQAETATAMQQEADACVTR